MTIEADLRALRRELFDTMQEIRSVQELYEFQVELAKHILASEQATRGGNRDAHKAHIHLLRRLGDGLAWMLLHPHTIRQLAKNPSAPPSLKSQAQGFEGTLRAAAEYTDTGVPVLVCDITNHLTIGDLVLCFHPELPGLVECKTRFLPQTAMRGRTGRQISRMMGTHKYLKTGRAKVYGEPEPRLTIQVDSEANHSFGAVGTAVRAALRAGVGVTAQSDHDVVWAVADQEDTPVVPPEVLDLRTRFEEPCIACHARAVDDPDLLVAPPVAWPIDPDAQFALLETDVLLFHLVDVAHFAAVVTQHGRVARVESARKGSDEYEHTFIVETDGKYHTFTSNPLLDVLYGYQTIESTVQIMTEAASKVNSIDVLHASEPPDNTARPKYVFIRSIEEARELSLRSHGMPDHAVVGMPDRLFDRLNQMAKRSGSEGPRRQ